MSSARSDEAKQKALELCKRWVREARADMPAVLIAAHYVKELADAFNLTSTEIGVALAEEDIAAVRAAAGIGRG